MPGTATVTKIKQESIPVGCVPPAFVVAKDVSPEGSLDRGVSVGGVSVQCSIRIVRYVNLLQIDMN